jgi:cytochrome c oxidase assembly protein subunit 11
MNSTIFRRLFTDATNPLRNQFNRYSTKRPRMSMIRPKEEISAADTFLYISSFFIVGVGLTYAAVPLYRIVCQATGLGGSVRTLSIFMTPEKMRARREGEKLRVKFIADTSASMQWRFLPQQNEVYIHPGETSLIFYKAFNPTNEDVIGISTYNVCII